MRGFKRYDLQRLPDHKIDRVDKLIPWLWQAKKGINPRRHWTDTNDVSVTAAIILRPRVSIVEARGGKVLPVSTQSRASCERGRVLQLAKMSKEYATQRNRSWFVRHDS